MHDLCMLSVGLLVLSVSWWVLALFKLRNVRSVADNSVQVCGRFALKAGTWKSLKRVSNNHKKNWQLEVACVYNHIFYNLFYDIFFTCSFLGEAIRSCCFRAWTSTRSTRWHETKGGNQCELSVLNKQDGKREKKRRKDGRKRNMTGCRVSLRSPWITLTPNLERSSEKVLSDACHETSRCWFQNTVTETSWNLDIWNADMFESLN